MTSLLVWTAVSTVELTRLTSQEDQEGPCESSKTVAKDLVVRESMAGEAHCED